MRMPALAIAIIVPLLGGCVVKTAYNVATLPVKAGGKVVDWTTTSQSEADRNAGRRMRHQQEREERERRPLEKGCRKRPDMPECQSLSTYRSGRPERR